MKKFCVVFGSAALASVIIAPASGADLSVKAPVYKAPIVASTFNWDGFYVGGNIGYAWGHSELATGATCGTVVPFFFRCGNQSLVQASGTGSLSLKGFTGGAQAGWNGQKDRLVYGAELDFAALNLRQSRTVTSAYVVGVPGVPFTTVTSAGIDWLFTARGRVGWTPASGALVYATGGLALTEIKVSNSFQDSTAASGAGNSSSSSAKVGWSAGVGSEWMLSPKWSFKAEYLYVDFGRVSTAANVTVAILPSANSTLTTSANFNAHIARVGVNYKL